jgi:putative transposase
MTDLYMLCGISKQGHLQALKEEKLFLAKQVLYFNLIIEARELHPVMGLRNIYETYQPEGIGRDAFILLGKSAGFQLENRAKPTRTTFSVKSNRYKNLLHEQWFTDINQVWVSDITYFDVKGKYYYITFIMDVYSRRIVGYHAADNMRAENNIYALNMALKLRGVKNYKQQLIHHSDKGSQYIANDYTNLLDEMGILISMCNEVYENAHIERVNGTIKNDYLIHYNIQNFEQLIKGLKKAVDIYNFQRPHKALNRMSPCQFEVNLSLLPMEKRTKINIFTMQQNVENPSQLYLEL